MFFIFILKNNFNLNRQEISKPGAKLNDVVFKDLGDLAIFFPFDDVFYLDKLNSSVVSKYQ